MSETKLRPWSEGDDISASHLNEAIDALNARGIGIPQSASIIPPTQTEIPSAVRLLVTSAAQLKSGLITSDGITLVNGDLILVATGGTPGNDGIYQAYSGPWLLRAKLNYAQTGNAPVMPHGWEIYIWDGSTSKGRKFNASVNGVPTF